jgi:superfamily II DNA or RNA helicase
MSLASKLAFQIDRSSQTKGYKLFIERQVHVLESSPVRLVAHFHGGAAIDVELTFEPPDLVVLCSCYAFFNRGACKHVWAAILEADKRGALASASAGGPLHLVDAFTEEEVDPDDSIITFGRPRFAPKQESPPTPMWSEHLRAIASMSGNDAASRKRTTWPEGFEVAYMIDMAGSRQAGTVVLNLQSRSRKKNGDWTVFKDFRPTATEAALLPDEHDVDLVSMLMGGKEPYYYGSGHYTGNPSRYALPIQLALKLLPAIAQLGKLWARPDTYGKAAKPVAWDPGEPWRFWASVQRAQGGGWEIAGDLRRADERIPLEAAELILPAGLLMCGFKLARFQDAEALPWIRHLTSAKTIAIPEPDRDAAIAALLESPVLPQLDLDPEISFEQRRASPRFCLRLKPAKFERDQLELSLLADYGLGFQPLDRAARGFWLPDQRVYLLRDMAAEDDAWQTLFQLGARESYYGGPPKLPSKLLPKVARELVALNWHVEAEGRAFRSPGFTSLEVTSGIDWFELHGNIDYGGEVATLPELLAALRRGESMVRLGDGSFGMLPEAWLQKFAPLAGLGQVTGDHLRFRPSQAGLLDALLAAQPAVRVDEVFQRARERLKAFHGVQPAEQPAGFQGQLRHYQLEGLGWIGFLRDFGFGGILADDMGVGKTAQVLAALDERRAANCGPSLVVAPRSLLFNWRQEAERFTPTLKVLEHAGLDRDPSLIDSHHLVLTTYGTLQRDIHYLSEREFDYVILDEAQAIKNASTVSAKAVRLLKGRHRLALSGTPVENHLGELWSLFEFLNPGMLGEAKVLKLTGGLARNPSEETRRLLAHALRPFILRRTKQQVARELPEKTEQTIYCELEAEQRRKYNQLRDHYRASLLGKASGAVEWNKIKIQVLEALLRLRQAACHTGLLDKKLAAEPSAKFTTLLAQLEELREEGHKALVFSQFTSLLALLRERLDESAFKYEYLDGATRDRQARVERFQSDPDCQLFLISLRAGGLGLNLTAAGYVFLLDPWWNPAVEAQAIDRAHRIGQTRNVFAYRLISRETVEEKVLELQKNKRELADAILSQDNSVLRSLTREDLELLLS